MNWLYSKCCIRDTSWPIHSEEGRAASVLPQSNPIRKLVLQMELFIKDFMNENRNHNTWGILSKFPSRWSGIWIQALWVHRLSISPPTLLVLKRANKLAGKPSSATFVYCLPYDRFNPPKPMVLGSVFYHFWKEMSGTAEWVEGTSALGSIWTPHCARCIAFVRYLTSLRLSHSSLFVNWEWKFPPYRAGVKIMTKLR